MIEGLSSKLQDATVRHYGADTDPLKIVPVVQDPAAAETIAVRVNKSLDGITETELAETANRIQARERVLGNTALSAEESREEALADRLNRIAVNAEIAHAHLAPNDFNEDARKAGPNPMPPVDYSQ